MNKEYPFQLGAMYWQNPNFGREEVEEDMRRIRDNNFNIIRAFIWWEDIERIKGQFNFKMHDIMFEAADKYGIRVMETLGLYLPIWLKKELAAKGIDDSHRRYACFDRPEIMGPMQNYIEQVVKRYKKAPALAIWNLWNEAGKEPCKCEHTLVKFAAWLKDRYKNTEELRNAWLGEHQVFTTCCPDDISELNVAWIQDAFRFATRGRATPMECDFYEFSTFNLYDNLKWVSNIVRNIDPAHERHSNPCSPLRNGIYNGRDEWKMAKTLDSIGVSIHPSHFFFEVDKVDNFPTAYTYAAEKGRSWADGKPSWVGELQAGTTVHHNHKYTATPEDIYHYLWQAFGRGINGVLFWEWQSWRSSMMEAGDFSLRRSHDGGPTGRSDAAAEVGAILKQNESFLKNAQRPPSQVAVVVSMSAGVFKFLQVNSKPHIRNLDNDHCYASYGCYKALDRANIAVDFITESQIIEGKLSDYKAVFLPHIEIMGKEVAAKLADYVHNGGWLWADGRCAYLDEHVYVRQESPGHHLSEVFGCVEADFIALRDGAIINMNDGKKLNPYLFLQYLEPVNGTPLAESNGHTVIVRNKYGKGTAELNGTYLTRGLQVCEDTGNMDYLVDFAKAAGVTSRLDLIPEFGFEACMLNSSEGDLIVVTNRSGAEQELSIKAPGNYASVSCPQNKDSQTFYDKKYIKRVFKEFETAVFICRINK